jgi:dihydrodipicolinate synthase/N-acetylneuraminate lyase
MSVAKEHLSRRTVLRRIGAAVALPAMAPAAKALGQTAAAGTTRLAPVANLELTCRNITAFKPNGDFDEEGQRLFCRRMIASKITLFPASGGSGQGQTLRHDELSRLYKVTLEECKGKVPVHANLPNEDTAYFTIEQAKIAIAAGVESVNIYGPAPVHGYTATPAETLQYFDDVFSAIKHPCSIGPNFMNPIPSAQLVAQVVNKYPQIHLIMAAQMSDAYYVALRDALKRDVKINVPFFNQQSIWLGANGVISNEASVLPKTHRLACDLFDKRDYEGLAKVLHQLERFSQHVSQFRTWHKVAMRAFKLPGWGIRRPYLDSTEDDVKRFLAPLPALQIPEVDELLKLA